MKTKAFKKGLLSILLAAVMLTALVPMSALAKTVDSDGKITATSFTLTGYEYGKYVIDCEVKCDDQWTARIEDSGILELVNDGEHYDFTADGFLTAGKQYYYGIRFTEHPDSPGYSESFDRNKVTMSLKGKTCELIDTFKYSEDNITYYEVVYKLPRLEAAPMGIDLTTVIEQGGNVAPGKASFELEVLNAEDGSNNPLANYTVGGKTVSTDGKGSFDSKLTIVNNDFESLYWLLNEGILVRQKKGDAKGWSYDEAVWCVALHHDPVVNALDDEVKTVTGYKLDFYKGKIVDGEFVADSNTPVEKITFTNTYTENEVAPQEPVKSPKTGENISLLFAALFVSGFAAIGAGCLIKSSDEK